MKKRHRIAISFHFIYLSLWTSVLLSCLFQSCCFSRSVCVSIELSLYTFSNFTSGCLDSLPSECQCGCRSCDHNFFILAIYLIVLSIMPMLLC
ncbi:hypothetical protein BDF19DRAFT_169471 [Syncephalis fuscata]|nr:hypothetical protein BDF19DRAFT_169471 [Syncephalis fuscata]